MSDINDTPNPGYLDDAFSDFEPELPPGSWEQLQARKRKRRLAGWWWWPVGVLVAGLGIWWSIKQDSNRQTRALTTTSSQKATHLPYPKPAFKATKPSLPQSSQVTPLPDAAMANSQDSINTTDAHTDAATAAQQKQVSSKRATTDPQTSTHNPTPNQHVTTQKMVLNKHTRLASVEKDAVVRPTNDLPKADVDKSSLSGYEARHHTLRSPNKKPHTNSLLATQAKAASIPTQTSLTNIQPVIEAPTSTKTGSQAMPGDGSIGSLGGIDTEADTTRVYVSAKRPMPSKVDSLVTVLPTVADTALVSDSVIKKPVLRRKLRWQAAVQIQQWSQQASVDAPSLSGVQTAQIATRLQPSYGINVSGGPLVPIASWISLQPFIGIGAIYQSSMLGAVSGEQAPVHLQLQADGSIIGEPTALVNSSKMATRWLLLPQIGLQMHISVSNRIIAKVWAGLASTKAVLATGSTNNPSAKQPLLGLGLTYAITPKLGMQVGAQYVRLSEGAVPGQPNSKATLWGLHLGLGYTW